jgi:hypothetical protein
MQIRGDLDGYTYYVNRNRKVVAYPASPALRPPSLAQQIMRARFALAMSQWRSLLPSDRATYSHACDQLSLCMWGANLFTYLSLLDEGELRSTIEKQTGLSLAVPPNFSPAAMALPGPQADKVAAWIAFKYK